MEPLLSALGILLAVLLVLAGAYAFTRWAGQSLGLRSVLSGSGRLEVLDRAGIGKDQALLVVRAGQRYLLLGSSPAGLSLLLELTREEGEGWTSPRPGPEEKQLPDFRALMRRLREKKND